MGNKIAWVGLTTFLVSPLLDFTFGELVGAIVLIIGTLLIVLE